MQARFDGANVAAELLVDAFVALQDDLVGVFHDTDAEAGQPGAQTSAAGATAVHASAVAGALLVVLVGLWEDYVFGFVVQGLDFFHPCQSIFDGLSMII